MYKDSGEMFFEAESNRSAEQNPVPSGRGSVQPFQDNFEHLMALEIESRMLLSASQQDALERSTWFLPDVQDLKKDQQRGKTAAASAAQLYAQLREQKTVRSERESLSKNQGITLLFDKITTLYCLDPFEQDVLMLLFMNAISHNFKALLEKSIFAHQVKGSEMEVGAVLSILAPEFVDQMRCRIYFSVNSRLIENEIIVGAGGFQRFGRSVSILEESFYVHHRIVNYIMGDNNVYSQNLRCIEIVKGRVDLAKLVLAGTTKDAVIEQVANYIKAADRRSELKLKSQFGYGTGLVCLFHGPSGTGKTMLAHGLAHHFKMNLLLIDLKSDHNMNLSLDELIRYAFREARLTNSIVFIDECDDIFMADTVESRILLVEIEKAEGITILATNKTERLDPALDRRIQLKVPLTMPEAHERERIWHSLIPDGVRLADDVDCRILAEKYQFSGGLIKNVLLAAFNMAVNDEESEAVMIRKEMIEKAAEIQSDQTRQYDSIAKSYKPDRAIENLPLNSLEKKRLKHLAACEKTGVLNLAGKGTLIISNSLETAIEAMEAVAFESQQLIRIYTLSELLRAESKNRHFVDPLNHGSSSLPNCRFYPKMDAGRLP